MSPLPPPVKLSILRDIGFAEWDPIGCQDENGGWEGSNAADEYDRYLLHVAVNLQRGEPETNLIDYLVWVETEHMGIGANTTAHPRAARTVGAIRGYVQDLT
jgi:hypothetical protein